MLTTADVLAAFAFLETAGLRRPDAWVDRNATERAAVIWSEALATLDRPTLKAACVAWLGTPERGRWWPTPADLAALAPRVPRIADTAEDAWTRLSALSWYEARDGAVERLGLTATEHAALASIGGMWAVTRAESDVERNTLRRRFLDHVGRSEERKVVALPPPTERRALPSPVLGFLGAENPEREAQRQRILAERRES